jgi:hypothetical protein
MTNIRLHAASYSCCFWFYVPFLNVIPGGYFPWLPLQRCGGLTAICVAAGSRQVAHCVKRLSFCSIQLESHLEEVSWEPWLAVVET